MYPYGSHFSDGMQQSHNIIYWKNESPQWVGEVHQFGSKIHQTWQYWQNVSLPSDIVSRLSSSLPSKLANTFLRNYNRNQFHQLFRLFIVFRIELSCKFRGYQLVYWEIGRWRDWKHSNISNVFVSSRLWLQQDHRSDIFLVIISSYS